MKIIIIILLVCITGCSTISGRKVVFEDNIKVDFKLEGKPLDRKGFKIELLNTSDTVFIKQNDSGFVITLFVNHFDTLFFRLQIGSVEITLQETKLNVFLYDWTVSIDLPPIDCEYFINTDDCNNSNLYLAKFFRVNYKLKKQYFPKTGIREKHPVNYYVPK